MCSKCGNDDCIGFYLLHPKELSKIPELKARELKVEPKTMFILINSPSSGEIYTKFKELHVINKKKG